MSKTKKDLEIQTRYIYKPEIKNCPHCDAALADRASYQWRKTVQQLDEVIYVASRAKECVNPECSHQGEPYVSATTVRRKSFGRLGNQRTASVCPLEGLG